MSFAVSPGCFYLHCLVRSDLWWIKALLLLLFELVSLHFFHFFLIIYHLCISIFIPSLSLCSLSSFFIIFLTSHFLCVLHFPDSFSFVHFLYLSSFPPPPRPPLPSSSLPSLSFVTPIARHPPPRPRPTTPTAPPTTLDDKQNGRAEGLAKR